MTWISGRITKVILVFMLFYLIFPSTAYAYIDPGSGSIVIQVIIATLVGALVAIKAFWSRIKTSVKNTFSSKRGGNDE